MCTLESAVLHAFKNEDDAYEQISVLLCTLTRNSPAVTGANMILMSENMFGNYTCRPRLCLIKGQSAEAHYIRGRSIATEALLPVFKCSRFNHKSHGDGVGPG